MNPLLHMPERERGDVVPTRISKEAWTAAMMIDIEVNELLKDYGFKRQEGRSRFTEALAKTVQFAINQAFDDAETKRV